jgi:hypothetical protein
MLLLIGTRAVQARANNMIEEPDAVIPHVRIRVGAVG